MDESGIIDPEAAFTTFRRQQQRRPSNLLHCMDEDGNIDAFRYIEYSRQRRMEFLKRADFICKMKSTLRMQQQLQRSASLPGMAALPAAPTLSTSNAAFPPPAPPAVTPEFLSKSLGRRNSTNTISTGVPDALRFMARSASMPFVSSFARNAPAPQQNATFAAGPSPTTQRRSLRKEEFEAAEALLFGMGRRSSNASEKKSEGEDETDADGNPMLSPNSTKKRKRMDLPLRTDEMGCSVLSVVSAEEDANSSSNNNILQEDEGVAIGNAK